MGKKIVPKMRGPALVLLLPLVLLLSPTAATAEAANRATLVTCTGCQLAAMPKLREGLFGPELNELVHLSIEWKQGATPTLTVVAPGDEIVHEQKIAEDMDPSAFVELLRGHNVNLARQTLPQCSSDPLSRFEFNHTEFLLFDHPVLRSVMLERAKELGGRPLMMFRRLKQQVVAKWLEETVGSD